MNINVNIPKMGNASNSLASSAKAMSRAANRIAKVESALKGFEGDAIEAYRKTLKKVEKNMTSQEKGLDSLHDTLEKIINLYEKCESSVASYEEGPFAGKTGVTNLDQRYDPF